MILQQVKYYNLIGKWKRIKHFVLHEIRITLYYSMIVSNISHWLLALGYENIRIANLQKRNTYNKFL